MNDDDLQNRFSEDEVTTILSDYGAEEDEVTTILSDYGAEEDEVTTILSDYEVEEDEVTTILSEEPADDKQVGKKLILRLISAPASNIPDVIEVNLSKGSVVLGRFDRTGKNRADFNFDEKLVHISRRHVQIEAEGDVLYLTDLGTINHTYLNDRELAPNVRYQFWPGDRIMLSRQNGLVYQVESPDRIGGISPDNSPIHAKEMTFQSQSESLKRKRKRVIVGIVAAVAAVGFITIICMTIFFPHLFFLFPVR